MTNDNKDWFYCSEEFQNYFKNGIRSLVIKANSPHFTILAASDAYLAIVQKERSELLNHNLFEVFPGSAADASEQSSVLNSFTRVIETKQTDVQPGFTYEIQKAGTGEKETEYWTNINQPVLNETGEVAYLINTTTNITQRIVAEQALQETGALKASLQREQEVNEELASTVEELRVTNEELNESQENLFILNNELEERVENRTLAITASEIRFRSLVEQIPAAINLFLTQDLVIDLPNDRMLEIWGRTFEEVTGKALTTAMPELRGQPFIQKLRDVISTGVAYTSTEERAFIQRNGRMEECYFDIIYQPIRNEDGTVTSLLQIAHEVTEEVVSRQKIQALNEELAAANEEMMATNEELAAINEEQTDTNRQLAEAIQMSEMQRERLNEFFMQAPVGICVLGGPDLVYELINPRYQELLPGRQLLGLPTFIAMPELVGTVLQLILQNVYKTGEKKTLTEWLVPVAEQEGGTLQDRFFTIHYMPRRNEKGKIDGVLTFVYEMTDQVVARKKVEHAEENLRIATESAELGTWSYYAAADKLTVSPRFREIFSLPVDEELSPKDQADTIHPDYQNIVIAALQASLDGGEPLYLESPIAKKEESKQRWVRVVGKRVQEANGIGTYITGVVADITEQKRDEQRKNDFIGMVSHELKTPLTSLNGYVQLLRLKANAGDVFTLGMLDKATKQVSKMTTMINGFLNISRLEAGKLQISKQRFDMAGLVKESEEETQTLYSSHRFVFQPVEETFINADRDKIGQVITNLISNAVKYSPANTAIHIACITVKGMALVSVKDEGIGIKDEDKVKLFDRYYRVNNDTSTLVAGFGIGLYLCAEIIQRHDGTIQVESEWGKGSTFSFTLPAEQA